MKSKLCINCGKVFAPTPQARNQTYCASPICQKQRKKKWQQNKLRNDPDYKENQSLAQRAWAKRNKDYWRKYRESKRSLKTPHQETLVYTQNIDSGIPEKMDASKLTQSIEGGLFLLKIIAHIPDAKMDSWIVKITRFHAGSEK